MNIWALAIALSSSLGLLLITTIYIWFRRSNVPFFKARNPMLMTLSQIYSYGSVVGILFYLESESCMMMSVLFSLLLPFAMGPMLMMIPQFLLNARVNDEKINRSQGIVSKIWKYKFLTRTDVQFLIICSMAVLHVSIYFIFSSFFDLEGNCYRLPLLLFDIEMILYFIPYGWLMHLIKNIEDPFNIRKQLISSWILTAPITLITILYPFVLYSHFDFRYVYMSSVGAMFLMMYLLPLLYQQPRKVLSDFTLYTFQRNYEELLMISEKTWSSENILFIKAVQEFRSMPTTEKAKEIYDLYISRNADMWINLSYKTSAELERRFENKESIYDLDLFQEAEKEIMILIKTNIYPYI